MKILSEILKDRENEGVISIHKTISIIVPVYNVKTYLTDCLDSILNQTSRFDEIILVNDGSSDGSGDICREYQSAYPEIILIEQKNAGLSEARNNGMRRATGDYIVFVDSDDWVNERMCETIKSVIADCGVDVLYYASEIVKEIPIKVSGEEYTRDPETANTVMNGFDSLKKLFPVYYQMSACMAAYRRSFLEGYRIDFIKDILYEDRFFSLRVITEAEKVMYITDKLYIRRFRESSIVTSPSSRRKIRDVMYGHQKEWGYIRHSEKWKKEKALTQYFVLCGAIMAYQEDVSSEKTQDKREEYLTAFFEEWLDCFDIGIMGENELCELLLIVKKAAESRRQELIDLFDRLGGIHHYQEQIRILLYEKYKKRMAKLPFGEKKQIGIYGAGAHTDSLFRLYRNLIGEVNAELYLIVSDEKDVNLNSNIVMRTLDKAADDWDIYLLSSKIYQEEMYQNLRKKQIPKEKIYRLYDKNDAVDCVMIEKALFD